MKTKRSDQERTSFEWFCAELDRLSIDERSKELVRGLLRRMAGQSFRLPKRALLDPERIRMALAMLRAGSTATEVRKEVAARLRCSPWTAQRIVTEALAQRASEEMKK